MRLKVFTIVIIIGLLTAVPLTIWLSAHQTNTRQQASGIVCNATGVTKNNDGTFSYAQLAVSSSGDIIDKNNPSCTIRLLGLNQGWLDSDATTLPTEQSMVSSQQTFHTNIVRVAVNSYWWKTNVFVPHYQMKFQDLLKEFVAQEQLAGNYVELNIDAAFTEPPCVNNGDANCPHQGQGRIDFANNPNCKTNPTDPSLCPQAQELEEYQPTALSALADLAQIYASNSGVIFDVWNEPGGYIFVIPQTQQFREQWMDTRINTVRSYAANSLVVVFTAGKAETLSHTQPNLLIDYHAYPNDHSNGCNQGPTKGPVNFTNMMANMQDMRTHGKAVIIGEFGGCNENPPSDPNFNQNLLSTAVQEHASLTYFGPLSAHKQVNTSGLLVQQDYLTIWSSLSMVTPTLSTIPNSTSTQMTTITISPACIPEPYCMMHRPYCYPPQPRGGWCNTPAPSGGIHSN